MTPATRAFIKSQAFDIDQALMPYHLIGVPPEEMVALLLDTGARIGWLPRPFIYLAPRSGLAALLCAGMTEAGFNGDAPGVRDFLVNSPVDEVGARAVKILIEEAGHLIFSPVPSGRVLTIAKVRDELAAMMFRPSDLDRSQLGNAS